MSIASARQLGQSEVKVSPIIFGAWAIGGWMWGGSDEQEAIQAIQASIDHGVSTIDTAAIYGMGHSEELVAKAIAGRRDQVVIATKCGMRWNSDEGAEPWPNTLPDGTPCIIRKNSKPDSIAYECEQSLKRLKVDVIDLYQIHWPDSTTPVEDSIRALDKLRQQGKIRAFGVSNYNAEWLSKGIKAGPIASNQPPYSLLTRGIEKDSLKFCREHKIGVICYSPMERGLLTGKVTPDRKFSEGDHRANHKYFTPENSQRVLDALKELDPLREKYKASYSQLVVNWTIQVPGITAAIVGARNAEQAIQNAGALKFQLTQDECVLIRKVFDPVAEAVNKK